MLERLVTFAASSAAAAWAGLATLRGNFWRAPIDDGDVAPAVVPRMPPRIHAVIPARNEADVIERSITSILQQQYEGELTVTLVDDRSTDATAERARAGAARAAQARQFAVVEAPPLGFGWTGKLWALAHGITFARDTYGEPDYWWLTDADIEHDATTLAWLVTRARRDGLDLTSLMVALHCRDPWERLLIPAFVFFFQKLYPFTWVGDPQRRTAAAAGGCMLVTDRALVRMGGLDAIADRLIDDCALAARVKHSGGWISLRLTARSHSIRAYGGLPGIWAMVARTAYTQLDHSPAILGGTVAGMLFLYGIPPLAVLYGLAARKPRPLAIGATAWLLCAALYLPTVRRYRLHWSHALTLPLAAVLYTAMTVDSARRHRRGAGGGWKGRTYAARPVMPQPQPATTPSVPADR